MAGKQFSVSFRIQGAMDGSLQAALQAASNAMRGLGNAARQASAAAQASRGGLAGMAAGLNQLQQAAQRYKQVQDALKQTTADMSKASQNLRSAREKYAADTAAVEQLKQKLQQLKAAQSELGTKKTAGNASLKQLRQDLVGLKQAYAEAKRAGDQMKISQLGSQIKSTQGAIQSQREQIRQMAQAYKELSAQVKQTKTDLSAAQSAQSASRGNLSSAQSDAQRLAASYKSQQAALNALKASLASAGFNTSNFAASEQRLASEIDRVNAALRQQQALSAAQTNSNAASQNMTMAGANFMGAIATAQQVAAPFQAAIDNAMTFEHSMSRVKALTQTGNIMAGNLSQVEAEMAKLEGQARQLGATTQFTMTQAADAMGYLGMAGWKTEQIYGTMPGMLNLAAGAGTDLARTADIVSDNMTAMGVPVEKAGHFMDVYAYALTNSNVNLESLGETMKYAAPVAAAFGATLEDTAAMTMMMGNAGIKGSMAGTALRMGLLRLSGPPKKASKALDEMGISVSDATAMAMEAEAELARLGYHFDENTDGMTKMQSIITTLSGKMATMTAEEKLASVSAIFGANAASGWINILEQGPEVFDKYLKALWHCDGYSEQFAQTMNDDTRGAMIALESAMDAVQNSIGTALLPAVRSAAEAFTPIASAIAIFIQQHPGVVQACAAIAAALTLIVVGAAAVKVAFAGWSFVTAQVALVRTALASLSSGAMFSGLIGQLTALRTALAGMATTAGWSTMFTAISTKATAAAASIRTFFASLTLGSAASGIAATLSSIRTAIAGAARAAMAFAFSPVGVALMALALAGLYCYQNWDKVSAAFSNVASIVMGSLRAAFYTVAPAIQNFVNILGQLGESSALKELASVVGGTLVQAFTALLGIAATAISVVIRGLGDLVKTVTDLGSGLMGAFYSFSEGNFDEGLSRLSDTASKTFDNIKQAGQHAFDGALNGAKLTGEALDVLNGKVTVAQQNALRQAPSSAPQFDDPMMNAAQVAQPPIDTSQTQAALDQVGNSAQNAATNLQGVDQAATGVQQLSTNAQTASSGVQQFGTSAQTASTGVQQLLTQATAAGSGVQQLGSNAQAAGGGIMSLSDAASGASGGVSALGSAASGAAGSVSGLGAAVQSACAALASAGASAAAAVASAAPAKNAQGGIYKKGAFLTTFAEESPEAAIPLDKSQRAIDLWTQAGQMLGQLPGSAQFAYDTADKDELGNVKGMDIPEFNRIKADDTEDVKIDKRRVQGEQLQALQAAARQTAEQIQSSVQQNVEAVAQAAASTNFADVLTDELGNLKGIDIPEFNRIKADDTEDVKIDKRRVQREQLEAQRQAQVQAQVPAVQPPPTNLLPRQPLLSAASERRLQAARPQTGLLENLRGGISQPPPSNSNSISFTINVTVNGNANSDEVKRGVEQAIPQLEDFAQRFASFQHEAARRSFA